MVLLWYDIAHHGDPLLSIVVHPVYVTPLYQNGNTHLLPGEEPPEVWQSSFSRRIRGT